MTDNSERRYVFGPVPSRRLGLSLGVDLVPYKACTLDCVYCQVGRTTDARIERGDFVPIEQVLAEIEAALGDGPRPDYVTMSGSGEPTLNARLGEVIDGVHRLTDVPVAVLTNGTLLVDPAVRHEVARADLVVPSLDAGDEATFQRVNRPAPGLTLERLVEGLEAFRGEFTGKFWLEVFIVAGVNDSDEQVGRIAALVDRIGPDRVQLNTATRPTADADVRPVSAERLEAIARRLGHGAEIVAGFKTREPLAGRKADAENVLAMIRRRPVTAADIAAGLGVHPNEVAKVLGHLLDEHRIHETRRDDATYYEAGEAG